MQIQEALSESRMEYDVEDFSRYKQYLNTLTKALDKCFEDQKEYLCCKKGCSYCCERGDYPYSQLEFNYLLLGFFKVEPKERMEIIKRIKKLKEEYSALEDKSKFSYRCPFLGDNGLCSVYEYRGLICRIFGIMTLEENGEYTIPFCQELGLNYSKVYNPNIKNFDYDKVKALGYKNYPRAHKVGLRNIMSKDFFEGEPINFGEEKPLIEWL